MSHARRLITENHISRRIVKPLEKDEESDSEDDADSVPELENEWFFLQILRQFFHKSF